MSRYFQPHPLGDPVNGSPHSVCVSLPTMADVIGYEEKDPRVLSAFSAGYPRFFQNPVIAGLAHRLAEDGCMRATDPILPTEAAAKDLCHFLDISEQCIAPVGSVWGVRLSNDASVHQEAKAFLQHTGCGVSSREAEDVLESWFGVRGFEESRSLSGARADTDSIRSTLHHVYGSQSISDIHLYRSGMNAFYAAFRTLQLVQQEQQRDIWIQLGWLYVDTSKILERFSTPQARPVTVYKVLDLAELKDVLADHGNRVAGIVTEVPTNPLVQTPDLSVLRELADAHKAALILDPSLVSPYNVDVLEHADILVNSLTKYAAREADVMMGALVLNPASRFYDEARGLVDHFGTPPYSGDLARMSLQIPHYRETIRAVNGSTEKVAAFLEKHPSIRSVHWASKQPAAYNYNWLKHLEAGPGGIISFTLKTPLARFYDRSNFVKSPSFGARFTMMCPFMYLAHYDLVKTREGRAELDRLGVDPDLIRLSVGMEPVDAILEELERSLGA